MSILYDLIALECQVKSKLDSFYVYDVNSSGEKAVGTSHKSTITFSCFSIPEMFIFSEKLPTPNHITCIIGIEDVYSDLIYHINLLSANNDLRISKLNSILLLVPVGKKPNE